MALNTNKIRSRPSTKPRDKPAIDVNEARLRSRSSTKTRYVLVSGDAPNYDTTSTKIMLEIPDSSLRERGGKGVGLAGRKHTSV